MKQRLKLIVCWFLMVILFFKLDHANAQQSKLIHYWDFNSTSPCNGKGGVDLTPINADFSLLGHAKILYDTIVTPMTCFCGAELLPIMDNVSGGTTLNQQLGYAPDVTCPGINNAVRIRNPAFGMQFIMYIPTTGFANIKLKYATTRTGTGPVEQFYSYSLDSGQTWTNSGLNTQGLVTAVPTYANFDTVPTVDFSAIPGANNNPKLAFRITFGDTSYYYKNQGTSGNERFDNITICGDSSCPAFVVQPVNQKVCPGTPVVITAQGGGLIPGFNLQWQQNKGTGWVPLANGGIYTGVTTDSLQINPVSFSMNGYQYRCVLTPTSGCGVVHSRIITLTVFPNPAIQANANNNKTTVCSGQPLLLFGSGGAQYYTWSGGIVDNTTFTATTSGTYTVTSTDVNGCTGTNSVSITVNPSPTVTINATATSICQGYSLTLTGQSSSTLNYVWSSAAVTNGVAFNADSSKTYVVVGTDSKGCTATNSVAISVTPAPTVKAYATKTTLCQGDTATLKGIGNAQSYSWSGGATDRVPFVPASTTYTVTATSSSTCTKTATITLSVNSLPTVTANATVSSLCQDSSVILTGKGALTYLWSGGVNDGVPFKPSSTLTYTVTGTDANGCVSSSATMVTVHPLPTVTASASSNPICAGQSISLTGSGASTYSWTGGITNNTPFVATATTTYSVVGKDTYGCIGTGSIQVVVKPLPTITFSSSGLSLCAGQTLTLYGHGGTSYAWSGGITNAKSFTPSASSTYTLTGSNSSGCSNSTTAQVVVNPLPVLTVTANPSAVCKGSSTILTTQGASNYTISGGVQEGIAFTPITSTTYTIVGTDVNGCSSTNKLAIPVNPLPIPFVSVSKDTVCKGASVTLTASGGINYAWSGSISNGTSFVPNTGTNYTVTVTDNNNCSATAVQPVYVNPAPLVKATANPPAICSGQSTTLKGTGALNYSWSSGILNNTSFVPLTSQTYQVVGTDANGCTATDSIKVTIKASPSITATITPSTTCAGDSVLLNATGANTYSWTPAPASSGYAKPIAPTTYTVVATALNGCTATATSSVTMNPAPPITILSTQTSVCPGQALSLLGMGGQTYAWSGGITQGKSFIPSTSTSYTVTGTDSLGCQGQASIHITVKADPVISLKSTKAILCPGDTMKLEATGASTYSWTPTTGLSGANSATEVAKPAVTATYTVTGSTLGCSSKGNYTITVKVATLPKVVAIANPPKPCIGQTLTLDGGGAKTYTWSGGVLNNTPFVPTGSANYTVTGIDSNGCKNSAIINVPIGTLPIVNAHANPPTICPGQYTTVTANANSAYTYVWSNGDTTNTFTAQPLFPITYSVTVSDGQCQIDTILPVNVNPGVTLNVNAPKSICFGNTLQLQASGATTYRWYPGNLVSDSLAANPTASPKTTTTYTLIAGNNGNCSGIDTLTIHVNPIPSAKICCASVIPVGQSANLQLTNLTPGAQILWSPSADVNCPTCADVTVDPKYTTTFNVTLSDTSGCNSTDTVTVRVEGGCVVFVPNAFSPNGDGKNDDLKVMGSCIEKLSFIVFDRWGNQVFQSDDPSKGWDGSFKGNPMVSGGYVYYLSATTYEGVKVKRTGEINLIR